MVSRPVRLVPVVLKRNMPLYVSYGFLYIGTLSVTNNDANFFFHLVSVFCEEPPLYADVCFIVDNHRFYCHKVRELFCIQFTAQPRSQGPLSSSLEKVRSLCRYLYLVNVKATKVRKKSSLFALFLMLFNFQ